MDRLRRGALVIACCLGTVGCSSDEDKTPTKEAGTTADVAVGKDASGSCESHPASAPLFTSALYDTSSICMFVDPRLPCYFTLEGCGGIGGNRTNLVTFAGDKGSSTFRVYDNELTSSTFGTPKEKEGLFVKEVAEIPIDTEVTIVSGAVEITFKFFDQDGKSSIEIISITAADCNECPSS